MLAAIFNALGGAFVTKLIDNATGLFDKYLQKQITKDQLQAQLLTVLVTTAGEIEKAHADSIAKTYATFMQAATQSPPMMRAWSIVVYSQLAVLLWHQIGIPAVVFLGYKYPSSGTTVDWAYALLAGMLGLGAVALRTGPAKFDMDKLKAMIGK